jgi:hypothetical protein
MRWRGRYAARARREIGNGTSRGAGIAGNVSVPFSSLPGAPEELLQFSAVFVATRESTAIISIIIINYIMTEVSTVNYFKICGF